jgi:hypothetical protein
MPGSSEQIVLSNDTSGFVAATKLDELPTIAGGQGDDGVRFISDVPGLSSIGTGNFQINGISISVDTGSDSLNDVIARINSSGTGATASLDRGANSVPITSTSASTNLVLDDGSSGFFSAVNITPDTSEPRVAEGKEAFSDADAVKQRLEEVGGELEAVFSQTFGDVSEDLLDEIRDALRTSIGTSFSELVEDPASSVVRSGFGIDFNFRDSSERVFDFDVHEFNRAARDEFDKVDKFLFRDGPQGTQDGLVGTLIETLKGLNVALADALGSHDGTGLIVDIAV